MPRDLDHLELPRVRGEIPRRLHSGGSSFIRADKRRHGESLLSEAEELVDQYSRRQRPIGISPTLVFRLKLHKKANIDEDQFRRMGLIIISHEPDKTLVAFSSDEALAEFKRYISEYAGITPEGHGYEFIAGIEDILPLTPEDRVGKLLRQEPLEEGELAPLDIEIMHPGSREKCNEYLDELRRLAESHGGRLSDSYIGEYLCLARCHLNKAGLDAFLRVEYIMEIDRKPKPTFETPLIFQTTMDTIGDIPTVPDDATGVLVIDSGVMGNHPLLRPALGEAEVFPDKMNHRIQGGPEDGDIQDGGHGTSVSGIAVYGDIARCLETVTFRPSVRLFSARVLDNNCEYDPDELVEHQIGEAVQYFIERYPQCKVINISLGDERLVLRDGQKQFRLAAAIDKLAYDFREHNILFVISAGNYHYIPENPEQKLMEYPQYILSEEAKIIDPGTSALALTVGSLSTGNIPYLHQQDPACRCIAGNREFPSPFTRTGFGVDGMIKPDVVDFGGDELFDRIGGVRRDPGIGIPTTAKDFAPPEGRMFRSVSGTSFSTPAVANIAARLFEHFPGASSNLIRALIADSARIPTNRPTGLEGDPWDETVLRVYGYGRPSFERAAFSDQQEVLLVAEDEIAINSFHLFEVPPLPEEFFEQAGDRSLSVTLAYDPPTRHTRGDSYQGVTMGFHLFRNTTQGSVEALFRDWKQMPPGELEEAIEAKLSDLPTKQKVDLLPGIDRRSKGTLQKGMTKISSRRWSYNGGPMFLAILCLRKWAPEKIERQRYAVVVSLRHSGEGVPLYDRMRQHLRIARKIKIRV